MAAHPADSAVLGNLFGTAAMRRLFGDRQRLQFLLDVEAALARAEAAAGVIPAEAAAAITAAARADQFDLAAIGASAALVGYPVVGLTRALAEAAGPEAGRWVHYGATTQDILDTATMLQVRAGLDLALADLLRVLKGLGRLAGRHRATVMAGRTHLQHALPITFGYKCAVWMQPLLASLDRLRALRASAPVVQLAGAVGTLASLGDRADAVHAGVARELGLGVSEVPWHVDRSRLVEVAAALAVLCGGLAKMAGDVVLLMQAEVAEVAEPHQPGRGSSSTMPQKRNPIASEYVLAATRGVHAALPLMLAAMVQDHERATGPWQSEDLALPQIFVLTSAALAHAATLAEGLVVDEARMARNLSIGNGLIMAEALAIGLADRLGRDRAHELVEAACAEALARQCALVEVLAATEEIGSVASRDELLSRADPAGYLGRAGQIVDTVLARLAERS